MGNQGLPSPLPRHDSLHKKRVLPLDPFDLSAAFFVRVAMSPFGWFVCALLLASTHGYYLNAYYDPTDMDIPYAYNPYYGSYNSVYYQRPVKRLGRRSRIARPYTKYQYGLSRPFGPYRSFAEAHHDPLDLWKRK